MKKLILTTIITLITIKAFAQEKTKYVEVMGQAVYEKEIDDYKLEIQVSLNYNSYADYRRYNENQETPPTLESVKNNYFQKLKKANLDPKKFKEDQLLFYQIGNTNKKGTYLVFTTNNKEEFLKVLQVKSKGVSIRNKKIKFKKINFQKLLQVKQKALVDAKTTASALAEASNQKLGDVIFIQDCSYNITTPKYETYYRGNGKEYIFKLNVRYELK